MKKSLIFGLIAVISAGLLLAGCSQATDGTTTYLDKDAVHGTIEADILQSLIDEKVAAGGLIVLADSLTIEDTNASVVDFKTAQVRVDGAVDAQGITINVVDASVTWLDDDAEFNTTGGAYLYRNAEDVLKPDNTLRISAGTGAQFVNRLQDIIETATAAAVRNFTFGPTPDFDYSTVPTGVSAQVNATGLATLYVLGTLTVPTNGAGPSIDVYALGTVDVTGNNDVVLADTDVFLTNPATLTSSVVGGAAITLPNGPTTLPNVTVESGKDITVKIATPGTFTINGKLNGPGTLKVTPAVTTVSIGGGNGNVTFTDTTTGILTAANALLTIRSTGLTTFDGLVTISYTTDTLPSVIAGNVVFKGGLTLTDGAIIFGGDITLYNDAVLTMTTADTVTLAAGKRIIVGGGVINGGSGATVPLTPVLEAVTGTLLTPTATATLTAPAAYISTATADEIARAKNITLADAALNISRGVLRVVPDGILIVDSVTLSTTGVDPGKTGILSLAAGAVVALSDNAGSIIDFGTVLTEATITGNATNATYLTASGGPVALGDDTISGAGAILSLGVVTGGTLDPVITTAASKNLTLDGVTLDLSTNGTVILPGVGGSLTLVNQGKLFLAEGGFANDWGFIEYDANPYYGKLGGGVRNALGATAQTDTATPINLNSIAHSSGGGVTIQTDGTNPLTFIKGTDVPQLSKTDS